ncbi:MAG: histidine kinase dimerization/phospho-acceptor domain-containing protein, partial [Methylococcales bacterium]
MGNPLHFRKSLFRVFLLPYIGLLALYLLVIGCGSTWLYLAARQAQTELVTEHIIEVVTPFVKQLRYQHDANKDKTKPFLLSQSVTQLYQLLPYLKQVSIRDRQHGYGVRLSFDKQLVDVELEPLQGYLPVTPDHQQLASRLHQETTPFFHITIALASEQGDPVQMDIAFDRAGLVAQITNTMQAIIHSIIGFSLIGFLSILIALAITFYTGLKTYRMDVRLQKIYQQAAMGKLSASLVHDLRNPLASIRANIKNLLITPEETEQVVDEMDHDILRLEQKLSDFLSLTKPRTSGFKKIDI